MPTDAIALAEASAWRFDASSDSIGSSTPAALLELRAYAFEWLNASAVLLDGRGVIVDTNEAWRLLALLNDGEPSATDRGVNYLEVCERAAARGAADAASVGAGLRSILAGECTHFDFDYRSDSPIEERWFRLQASSAPVSAGSGIVLLHVDVTADKLRERQLEHQAERDSLTGLPNRDGAHRHLARLLADEEPVIVMFVDLDEFKSVNDTYGHHTGDELLAKVSSRLCGAVRSEDMVCRLGGDEFVVICSGLEPKGATSITARIAEVMTPPFQVGANSIRVGASVGCAMSAPGSTVGSLLHTADAEMYAAKGRSLLGSGIDSSYPAHKDEHHVDDGDSTRAAGTEQNDHSPAVTAPEKFNKARLSTVVHRSTDVAMFSEGDGTTAGVSPASNDLATRIVKSELKTNRASSDYQKLRSTDLTGDPDVGFVIGNLRDLTDQKISEERMSHLAFVDDLTGLLNRNALAKAIADLEDVPNSSCDAGLILFDLDEFCDVNDTLGHDVGDALLSAIAQRVRAVVPSEFLVARFGSNQFAVFGESLSCPHTCRRIAATLHSCVSAVFQIGEHELITSATMGIAISSAGRVGELIRNADAALHHAKKLARGGTTYFRPQIADEAARRLRRTGELRRAVSRGEILAHYQPVVELESGQVVGVEALARWRHPDHGWVPPDEFILLAETTGLIEKLGHQILEQSCADAAQWLRRGRRLQLAVNASGAQLTNASFVPTIDAALEHAGLPANQLTVEITETTAVADPATALAVLTALRERSVTLSLDDFGTGYSPLAALRDLPAASIKLDRTFVAGLGSERGDDLAAGVIQLALAVGVHVVAEGVETQEQADQLREMGCRYGQGHLWSPAVPGSDLLATIARIESVDEQAPEGCRPAP